MSQRNHGILSLVFVAALMALLGCGGGGSSSGGGNLPQTSAPPTVTLQGWTPNDATLLQYKAYAFTASATDPNIGGTIAEFQWDFGDGTKKVSPAVLANGQATATFTYAYVTSGAPILSVVAKNAAGLLSPVATRALTVTAAPSPLTVAFTAPVGPMTINPPLGGTYAVTFDIHVVNTGAGTISASGIVLDAGDPAATQVVPVGLANGDWRIVVTYPAAAAIGSRTVTPSVKVIDSKGISSAVATGPVVTVKTVALVNSPPVINLTTPATDNTVSWTSKPFNLGFTLNDADNARQRHGNILRKMPAVGSRIADEFVTLVKNLGQIQRLLRTETEQAIRMALQFGQIIEKRRRHALRFRLHRFNGCATGACPRYDLRSFYAIRIEPRRFLDLIHIADPRTFVRFRIRLPPGPEGG